MKATSDEHNSNNIRDEMSAWIGTRGFGFREALKVDFEDLDILGLGDLGFWGLGDLGGWELGIWIFARVVDLEIGISRFACF